MKSYKYLIIFYILFALLLSCSRSKSNGNDEDKSIADNTPPVIEPISDITKEATGVETIVTLSVPVVKDDIDKTPVVTNDAPVTFPLGKTVVTFTATDSSGNKSTATVNIIIQDTTPPVINNANDITINAVNTLTILDLNGVIVTDLVDQNPVLQNDAPVNGLPVGLTKLTYTATDSSGNKSTAIVTVTIKDTTPPVINNAEDITINATKPLTNIDLNGVTVTDLVDMNPVLINDAPAGGFSVGVTKVTFTATDASGNTSTKSINIIIQDITPPTINFANDITMNATSPLSIIYFSGVIATDLVDTNPVLVNDAPAGGFPVGITKVTFTAMDASGNKSTKSINITIRDITPPTINNAINITMDAVIPLTIIDLSGVTAADLVDPNPVITNDAPAGGFPVGITALTFTATDSSGNSISKTINVTMNDAIPDTTPPETIDDYAHDGEWVKGPVDIHLAAADSRSGVAYTYYRINYGETSTGNAISFVNEGAYTLEYWSVDNDGNNESSKKVVIKIDNTAPVVSNILPIDGATFRNQRPAISAKLADTLSGVNLSNSIMTVDGNAVTAVVTMEGMTYIPSDDLAVGNHTISISVNDIAGNLSSAGTTSFTILNKPVVPPDPSTKAPVLDKTVATTMIAATGFLYSGENPIQTGVESGTIDKTRLCVLRGKVLQTDGTPIPGVIITILNHPEFGQTVSREDGMFDMAVNGGGYITVNYEMDGYMPSQRQINTPWQDYAILPDIVLMQLDSKMTTIELNSSIPLQIARGSIVTDEDGYRQATILVPQNTQAELVMKDGSTKNISNMNIHITEYTVGDTGVKAMPGELPPTSGYTYCVEYSVEEAIGLDAASVKFSKTLYHYNENFLGFPVGGIVPVGYYDRVKGVWVPSNNGRVIQVLDIDSNGLAELDVTGTGIPATDTELADLGITDEERLILGESYSSGQSLWRVPITHFTPVDYNWPFGPPSDARSADVSDAGREDKNTDKPKEECGSIIEVENQTLGESINIAGTPFSLNYRSDRVYGRKASRTLKIPISGDKVPASLKRIELNIEISGRQIKAVFPPDPNLNYIFEWDGLDTYGRKVYGRQKVRVEIGYIYDAFYRTPSLTSNSFGRTSGSSMAVGNIRTGFECNLKKITDNRSTALNNYEAKSQGLGGWTLNLHHSYNPVCQELNLGNGENRTANNMNSIITTVAGGGNSRDDGILATKAAIFPNKIAIGSDGSIYIADGANMAVNKIDINGIFTKVAGNGVAGYPYYSGDGGPATQAELWRPEDVKVGSDGSIYIADTGNHRIRKVNTDGIITTVAGNGVAGFSGDGGPATQAQLYWPKDITIGLDGSLYIADSGNNRIRCIGNDGIITTVAGNGDWHSEAYRDGLLATEVGLNFPKDVTVDNEGNIYVNEAWRIRKISTNGIITAFAGTGKEGPIGDGGPAIQAFLINPGEIVFDTTGILYIADSVSYRMRRVSNDGIITTIAGNGTSGFSGDGGAATQATIGESNGIAVTPGGLKYYIADTGNRLIRLVQSRFPSFSGNEIAISSEDGTELYKFSPEGRHLETLNTTTGLVKYTFTYNAGLLIQVRDAYGNITSIERNSSGEPTAIVSPSGQRTLLTVDNNGYLADIINPSNETIELVHDDGGLLTKLSNARGNDSIFTYNEKGFLVKDTNPAGGFTSLSRTESGNITSVTTNTAEGRQGYYTIENLLTGDILRTDKGCCVGLTTTLIKTDGTTVITASDGTVTKKIDGTDPRFGIASPIIKDMNIQTPAGLTYQLYSNRTVTLGDPNNLLSLTTQTDTTTINGKTYTAVYNANTKTLTTTSPAGRQTLSTIDSLGRLIHTEVGGLAPVNYTYDDKGRVSIISLGSGINLRSSSISYNNEGFIGKMTDPLGSETGFSYDATGRVIKQVFPDMREIDFSYDANGNAASITPPGKPSHGFVYNIIDMLEQYTPPAISGIVHTLYSYTLDKNIKTITRPDGKTINYEYTSAGKVDSIETPSGFTFFTYDSTSGLLTGINTPENNALQCTYDGSLLTGINMTGEVAGSILNVYDNNFRVTSVSVNGSNAMTYSYDNDGLLISAGDLTINRDSANGSITGSNIGSISDLLTYNIFGENASYNAFYNGNSLFETTYTRDKLGRITDMVEVIAASTNVFTYNYDISGRLVEVKKNGSIISSYFYDANGNRLANNLNTGTYDDQDRMLSYGDFTFEYTSNGELISKTGVSNDAAYYDYDVLGNLKNVTLPDGRVIEYVIDGKNRRIGKKINGTLVKGWLYSDGLTPIAELDGSGNVIARFISKYMIKGGINYRVITDHLGSPRMVVNVSTGEVAQRIDYDEFGNVLLDTNPGFQPFGFAGGIYDNDTGLVRFGARDYDAYTGRWTSKDPIRFDGVDTDLYGYCGSDPVNNIDLTGLKGGVTRIVNQYDQWASDQAYNQNLIGALVLSFIGSDIETVSKFFTPISFIETFSDPCSTGIDKIVASIDLATWGLGKAINAKWALKYQRDSIEKSLPGGLNDISRSQITLLRGENYLLKKSYYNYFDDSVELVDVSGVLVDEILSRNNK